MLTPTYVFLTVIGSILWLAILLRLAGPALTMLGLVRPNFQGKPIPVGLGLVILLWSAPVLGILSLAHRRYPAEIEAYLAILAGMGALGLADDLWGNRRVTGLRGHLRAALRGEITTGFVKAGGGLLLSIAVTRGVLRQAWPDALLDAALIALYANALNLLDVRPGRACAVFLLVAMITIVARLSSQGLPWLVFLVVPTLPVYRRDARAEAMLGDSGSNLLGGALGLALVFAAPSRPVRAALLALVVLLHVVSERASLSALIERNPVLRRLDDLTGVRNPGPTGVSDDG